jgi:NADPH2:quinone reductase
MKAIRVRENGGPENLVTEEIPVSQPQTGQARVKIHAAGLNFIDVYHRTGLYKTPLPFTPGMEAAGVVDAVGPEVSNVNIGDRVAYAMSLGAYAEYAVVAAKNLVVLPPTVDFQTGAASMLQGMTAHYLTHSTFPLQAGQTALVHAAAGGAGSLIVQMAKIIGARVIGTVSSEEKAEIARAAGTDHVVLYSKEDFLEGVKKHTEGRGVDVVYDSVGQATFHKSLDCLRPRGMLVLFGQSSGPVPPFDPNILNPKGSLFLTRPSLAHYVASREELEWRAGDLFRWISSGKLVVRVTRTYPLDRSSDAHRALEGRKTTGKVVLLP